MQLFVRLPAGGSVAVQASAGQSVAQLRQMIADVSGVPAVQQRLVCNGKPLIGGMSLAQAGVADLASVECNVDLLGGAKKRKKKVLVGPKKKKHVHVKVKLAVLKYYKVDENNKITRLRPECTDQCKAATFMAIHPNRYSCGRCGFTLRQQGKQ